MRIENSRGASAEQASDVVSDSSVSETKSKACAGNCGRCDKNGFCGVSKAAGLHLHAGQTSTTPDGDRTFAHFHVDVRHPNWRDKFVNRYNSDGMVTVDGLGSREEFVELSKSFGVIFPHRDSEADGLTKIASSGTAGNGVG